MTNIWQHEGVELEKLLQNDESFAYYYKFYNKMRKVVAKDYGFGFRDKVYFTEFCKKYIYMQYKLPVEFYRKFCMSLNEYLENGDVTALMTFPMVNVAFFVENFTSHSRYYEVLLKWAEIQGNGRKAAKDGVRAVIDTTEYFTYRTDVVIMSPSVYYDILLSRSKDDDIHQTECAPMFKYHGIRAIISPHVPENNFMAVGYREYYFQQYLLE